MNEQSKHPSPEPGQGRGYEITDVNVASIAAYSAGLSVLLVVVCLGLCWLYREMEKTNQRPGAQLIPAPPSQQVPVPRLQTSPADELAIFRKQELDKLATYRWIDRNKSIAQIPVNRAMQILSERGFPEPQQTLKPEKGAP